ncbi:MAG: polysaccharide deacetylase [Pseudonocardiales bacterium]|nr:MAG: polysaccharide deacetylase [Pseudonocardiales bacterium]
MTVDSKPPALVISLDFELHWGVRDRLRPDGNYRTNLLGARTVVTQLLGLFSEYQVAATWGTVGYLFAATRKELSAFHPKIRPLYVDSQLDPYRESVGSDEISDPLHYAWSLVEKIGRTAHQEIASHTYSHYYCEAEGQNGDSFRADLAAAKRIAAYRGISLQSLILPRNQWNPSYAHIVKEEGFTCYRGVQRTRGGMSWPYSRSSLPARITRLADAHLNICGDGLTAWPEVIDNIGLCNVPASRFLRPVEGSDNVLVKLRLQRIRSSLVEATKSGRIYHLWWHPHNFGARISENIAFLRQIFEDYRRLHESDGLESLSMADVSRHSHVR